MSTISSSSSSLGASTYALKQSEKVMEKTMTRVMESLPQTSLESAKSDKPSALASEGIGGNLDLKG